MNTDKGLPPEKTRGDDSLPNSYSVPESIRLRWLIGFVTIIIPVISFAIVHFEPYLVKPDWQSGEFSDYVRLMFSTPVPMYYYPFLIYAMVSMGLLLSKPNKYETLFPIRFGIYTGVILSLQYSLLVLLSGGWQLVLVSAAVWVLLILLMGWLIPTIKSRWPSSIKWFAIVICIFIGFIIFTEHDIRASDIRAVVELLVFSPLPAGPITCLIVSVWVSTKLIKNYGFTHNLNLQRGIGVLAWALAYISAWRHAVTKTLELYAELPTSPCYIATAAARGHAALVKSSPVRLPGGETMRVNPQLRYLKCGEVILQNVTPRLHTLLRAIYDRLGRRLAARITHPLLADLAYLSLKPVEWGARLWLSILVPNVNEIAARVYPDAASPRRLPK